MESLEIELMAQMDAQGLDKSSGGKASVTVYDSVKPQVVDWDAFHRWIKRHDAFYMLEKRPSVTACREVFESKGKIPGVVPFIKRQVLLRTRD